MIQVRSRCKSKYICRKFKGKNIKFLTTLFVPYKYHHIYKTNEKKQRNWDFLHLAFLTIMQSKIEFSRNMLKYILPGDNRSDIYTLSKCARL